MTDYWIPLTPVSPPYLKEARTELHWATQVVASAGASFIPAPADHSHIAMTWSHNWLVGEEIMRFRHFQVGLDMGNLTLLLLHKQPHPFKSEDELQVIDRFPLKGKTLTAAFEWLETTANQFEDGAHEPDLKFKTYSELGWEIPDHYLAQGSVFHDARPAVYRTLSHWVDNAHTMLSYFKKRYGMASEILLWPKTFHLAFKYQPLDKEAIEFGFSLGDTLIEEPYFYCMPHPKPNIAALPALNTGQWQTKDWVGAYLSAAAILEAETPQGQADVVRMFFENALLACEVALGWRVR